MPMTGPQLLQLRNYAPEAADEIGRLRAALEIIAGRRQCIDNLMSNVDVAIAALDDTANKSP